MDNEKLKELMVLALEASFSAGKKILEIYDRTFSVDYKADGSPLSEADQASHDIIQSMLHVTGLPILSEEGKEMPFEERSGWKYYWLVDPLDGTKEFIKRNGEFTVNIALMENNHPIAGIVLQPVTDKAFLGIIGTGLYKFTSKDALVLSKERMIRKHNNVNEKLIRVIASRTHSSHETNTFIDGLRSDEKKIELLNAGSSLKFCLLAEGSADIYPRFAPTMEWDTAAGHALLKSIGKNIYLYPGGAEMTYNKPQLLNDWFIAR